MHDRQTYTITMSACFRQWLINWHRDSGLPLSHIIELLICDKAPSKLIRRGLGFEFKPIKTTYDLLPDGTVEPDVPRRFRRFGTVNESREHENT